MMDIYITGRLTFFKRKKNERELKILNKTYFKSNYYAPQSIDEILFQLGASKWSSHFIEA